MQTIRTRSGLLAQSEDLFLTVWLLAFLSGALVGLLAARYSALSMGDALAALCAGAGARSSALSLFGGVFIFFLLTVLLSLLPGRRVLLACLTAAKGLCGAFSWGVFYQFRSRAELDGMLLRCVLHTALILPACYALASQSLRFAEGRNDRSHCRYLPILLPFLYAVAVAVFEWAVWGWVAS